MSGVVIATFPSAGSSSGRGRLRLGPSIEGLGPGLIGDLAAIRAGHDR